MNPRPNLEDLYAALDLAIDSAAGLVAIAQAVLPDDVSLPSFVALSELCRLKLAVNPGPTEEDPF
jgi:hypothetical protein